MNTYQIYQVPFESDLMRDVFFYDEDSTIYNMPDAQAAFSAGEYKCVGSVEANDLADVVTVGNLGGMPKGARSLSVGDIIVTESADVYIVAPFGFDELFSEMDELFAERAVA